MLPLVALVAMLFIGQGSAFSEPPSKAWLTSLAEAKARAKQDNKPVLAMLSAAWCPPCKYMKANILPTPEVQKELSHYTLLYVDADENREDSAALDLEMMPTFVVLNTQGDEIGRFAQAQPKTEDFLRLLGDIRRFNERAIELERKIEKSPDDPALLKAKGDLLSENNMLEKGLDAYRKAVVLDPGNKTGVAADIEFFDAIGKIDAGNTPEGVKMLDALPEKYPNSPRVQDVIYTKALLAIQAKDIPTARARFNAYLQKYPNGKFRPRVERMLKLLDEADKAQAAEESAKAQPAPQRAQ